MASLLIRALLTLLIAACPLIATAQGAAWTADEAVARALAAPALQAVLEAEMRAARAALAAATAVPAPRLGLGHERTLDDAPLGATETTVQIEQQIDLSGWRGRLEAAAPHREAALRAEAEARRLDIAAAVRTAFFTVRYHQDRIAALDGWIARLERGETATAARKARGDAALYDLRRVERESEMARARRAREGALAAEAWARLATWTPWEARPVLTGALLPRRAEAPAPTASPRIAHLEHLDRAARAEAEAWGGPFWRGWVLGAGYRLIEEGGERGHGILASLWVPLTLWNTDRPRQEALRAEQDRIGGELGLARTRAQRVVAGAEARLAQILTAIEAAPPRAKDAELTGLAEAAYNAGEGGLTELLDAFESETDLELARVDLHWEARRAAIELDRLRGLGVPR